MDIQSLMNRSPADIHKTRSTGWQAMTDKALLEQEPINARFILYLLVSISMILLVWASLATIDEVTRGRGKVIPSRQVQVMQSLDGGVVTEIHVREGDLVGENQLLVKLDPTRSVSSLRETQAQYLALKAKSERLKAISDGVDFVPSVEISESVPGVAELELAIYQSTLEELTAEKAIAEQQLRQRQQELRQVISQRDEARKAFQLTSRELLLTRPLVASGAVSEVELLRLERDVSSLRGERDQAEAKRIGIIAAVEEATRKKDEVELQFKNRIREELSETMARISSLKESKLGLSDRVKMTEVRSPVKGTVSRIHFNTIGGVVSPGRDVVEIVPADDSLLLEARISPKDIAFLRPGQEAVVKFTAYDFVVYGGLDARVEHIGADTITDEDGNAFYPIKVRTEKSTVGDDNPILPGMVAEVDILTGKKTILNYLLKPVLRAKQYALTER